MFEQKTYKYFNILLLISNIFYFLLYLTLCFNNRLAVDDFYYLANYNTNGIIGGTIVEYGNWSTRWASVLLNSTVLSLYEYSKYALLIFGISNFLALTFSVFLLLKNTFQLINSNLHFETLSVINISVFIVSVLFISTFKIDETWFWLCASCTYLWSIILFILGVAWILNRRKHLFFSFISCLAFLYIGGSSEPFALIVLFLLLVFLILVFYKKITFNISKNLLIARSIIALICCLLGFIILYLGEGIRTRETFFDSISIFQSLLLNIKMTGIIILKRLPYILAFPAVLCIPFIKAGQLHKQILSNNWKKNIAFITIAYFSLIYIFQLSITYKTQDVGAYRALFPITIFTFIYFSVIYYILGQNLTKQIKSIYYIFLPLIISISIFSFELYHQTSIVYKYANQYDKRIDFLIKYKSCTKAIEVNPLPNSGMLYSAEISSDSSYFSNKHIKIGLGLNCSIILKNNEGEN